MTAFPLWIGTEGEPKEDKNTCVQADFGFLASLAITNALRTYYDGYIKGLSLTLPTLINGVSDNFVSTLLLIDFFIVAIPLTHAGYLFLSSLNIDNVKKNIQGIVLRVLLQSSSFLLSKWLSSSFWLIASPMSKNQKIFLFNHFNHNYSFSG